MTILRRLGVLLSGARDLALGIPPSCNEDPSLRLRDGSGRDDARVNSRASFILSRHHWSIPLPFLPSAVITR